MAGRSRWRPLANERGLAASLFGVLSLPGEGRTRDEASAEAAAYLKTCEWYPQRAGRADLAPVRARALGAGHDPVVRDMVAHLHATERVARLIADRSTASRRAGRPGPEGSIGKLSASRIAREAALAHTRLAGADGMLTGADAPENGIVAELLVSVPGASIAGGTDEIQHNIIGERVLGLSKDPSVDSETRSGMSTSTGTRGEPVALAGDGAARRERWAASGAVLRDRRRACSTRPRTSLDQPARWNVGKRRPSLSSTSHATCTRRPHATDSGGHPVMLVNIRYPSSSSTRATTYGTSSAIIGFPGRRMTLNV
jgi:hypothetical protein